MVSGFFPKFNCSVFVFSLFDYRNWRQDPKWLHLHYNAPKKFRMLTTNKHRFLRNRPNCSCDWHMTCNQSKGRRFDMEPGRFLQLKGRNYCKHTLLEHLRCLIRLQMYWIQQYKSQQLEFFFFDLSLKQFHDLAYQYTTHSLGVEGNQCNCWSKYIDKKRNRRNKNSTIQSRKNVLISFVQAIARRFANSKKEIFWKKFENFVFLNEWWPKFVLDWHENVLKWKTNNPNNKQKKSGDTADFFF